MGRTIGEIEQDIRRRWKRLSPMGKALWSVVRDLVETDPPEENEERMGLIQLTGHPTVADALATLVAGRSASADALQLHEALSELTDAELLTETKNTWRSDPLATLLKSRKRDRDKKRVKRGGDFPPQQEGTVEDCPRGQQRDPPPMVSPPITPSSLSPSISLCAEAAPQTSDSGVSVEEQRAAYQAFDQWSSRAPNHGGRGYGLNTAENEHTHVHNLLDILAQEPPVIHLGQQVLRHRMVPIAAAALAKGGTPFKGIQWACKCVRNQIENWGQAKPEQPPRRSQERQHEETPQLHRAVKYNL